MFDKVIFLDIDGVLNHTGTKARIPGTGWYGIDSKNIKVLKEIVEKTGAQIVLSSTWRETLDENLRPTNKIAKYMLKRFADFGLVISGATPDIRWVWRGVEIKEWMKEHPTKDFVILDDEWFRSFDSDELKDHYILTDIKEGLTEKHVSDVIEKLGLSEKK